MSEVIVELTAVEAFVPFDWSARFNQIDKAAFEYPAERRVFFDLDSKLEGGLTWPFEPNYKELLADARNRVRRAA
ncbi:MAG TPA: hypothetical protein PLR41_08375 [Alphaproteobacteria bacterium]|nr:hypothetical protein [Alphaproteobacteria bacterium]